MNKQKKVFTAALAMFVVDDIVKQNAIRGNLINIYVHG